MAMKQTHSRQLASPMVPTPHMSKMGGDEPDGGPTSSF